jgi:hypothetical protein
MPKYLVHPTDTTKRGFTLEADSVDQEPESGATVFRKHGAIVARLFNVSFRKVA